MEETLNGWYKGLLPPRAGTSKPPGQRGACPYPLLQRPGHLLPGTHRVKKRCQCTGQPIKASVHYAVTKGMKINHYGAKKKFKKITQS